MWIRKLLLIITGVSGGAVTAAGFFAVIAAVGVINRFADYSKTAFGIRIYEIVLCAGGILGNLLFIFTPGIRLWGWLTILAGLAVGMFIGCFLLSLAEAVKGLPVFWRRIRLQKGISIAIIAFAIGKTVGSLFYFCCYLLESQV